GKQGNHKHNDPIKGRSSPRITGKELCRRTIDSCDTDQPNKTKRAHDLTSSWLNVTLKEAIPHRQSHTGAPQGAGALLKIATHSANVGAVTRWKEPSGRPSTRTMASLYDATRRSIWPSISGAGVSNTPAQASPRSSTSDRITSLLCAEFCTQIIPCSLP